MGKASFGHRKIQSCRKKPTIEPPLKPQGPKWPALSSKIKMKYLGRSRTRIRDIFGSPDGWFISEHDPAYFINDADRDVWQIVFLIESGKVSEIVVDKNCC